MHSSIMRTGRALTVPGGGGCTCLVPGGCTCLVPGRGCTCLVPGGVPAWSQGGVPASRGGVPAWSGGKGVYLPGPGGRGCTCLVLGGVPAWSRGVPAWSWGGVPARGGVPAGGCTCQRGGCTCQGGVPARGGVPDWKGGYLVRYSPLPPPVNRMTDRCKNITLAKTSFRPVMIYYRPQGKVIFSENCAKSLRDSCLFM